MANKMKKFMVTLLAVILAVSMFATSALAAPKSKTSAKIHGASAFGNNNDVVAIKVPQENGQVKTYKGSIKGDTITVDMNTTENYFHVSAEGISAAFENETQKKTGTFLLLGKEGNGTHKPGTNQETDEGLNNFDAVNVVFDKIEDDEIIDDNKDDEIVDDNKDDEIVDDNKEEIIENEKKEEKKETGTTKKTSNTIVVRRSKRNLVTISDDDVPLANVPKTGDNTLTIAVIMLAAVIGAIALIACKTRREMNF